MCVGSPVLEIKKKKSHNILKYSIKWHLFSKILFLRCCYALHTLEILGKNTFIFALKHFIFFQIDFWLKFWK